MLCRSIGFPLSFPSTQPRSSILLNHLDVLPQQVILFHAVFCFAGLFQADPSAGSGSRSGAADVALIALRSSFAASESLSCSVLTASASSVLAALPPDGGADAMRRRARTAASSISAVSSSSSFSRIEPAGGGRLAVRDFETSAIAALLESRQHRCERASVAQAAMQTFLRAATNCAWRAGSNSLFGAIAGGECSSLRPASRCAEARARIKTFSASVTLRFVQGP